MSKVNTDEIHPILKANIKDDSVVSRIEKQIEKIVQEAKDERAANKGAREKNESIIILSDPEGKLPANFEVTGWVVNIKEGDNANTILERLHRGIFDFNASKKGKKNPIKTLGEGIMHVTRKFFKSQKVDVRTKEPVRVLVTNNRLPQEAKTQDE